MNSKNFTNYWALITSCNHQIYCYIQYLWNLPYWILHIPITTNIRQIKAMEKTQALNSQQATKSLFEPLEHTSLINFLMCLSSLSWFVWSYHFYCSTHWREFCWFQSIAVKHTEERKKRDAVEESIHWIFYIGVTHCCVQLAACSVGT
jgi:hypothetical protein